MNDRTLYDKDCSQQLDKKNYLDRATNKKIYFLQ